MGRRMFDDDASIIAATSSPGGLALERERHRDMSSAIAPPACTADMQSFFLPFFLRRSDPATPQFVISIFHLHSVLDPVQTCNMQHDAIKPASLSPSPSTTHNISMPSDGLPGRLFSRVLLAQL
jgi:hypothetical protein